MAERPLRSVVEIRVIQADSINEQPDGVSFVSSRTRVNSFFGKLTALQ